MSLPGVIAVVGCDGAGKSTLCTDLIAAFGAPGRVEFLYLGQSSGNIATAIRSLPLVGPAIGRYLLRRSARAHQQAAQPPDTLTAVVIHLLSQWRAHKFRRLLALSRRGVVVIADRYPQAEMPGFYFDGPGLDPGQTSGWLPRWLAARELRLYQWMASHVPALVIRLNIDAATAHARKPDHKLTMLQDKVRVIPGLHFNGARTLELDATDPYPQVLARARQAVEAIVIS
ncbi:MAG: hypothetical protein AB7V26_08375 [Lysobacterales bacterium]